MQRLSEWTDQVDLGYHERQFEDPYRSTIAFCDWLEAVGYLSPDSELRILDVGAGLGANIHYMARRYPLCRFVGVDINEDLVRDGNARLEELGSSSCRLVQGDLYGLSAEYVSKFDGVVSLQTLSWLPGFEEPLRAMLDLLPSWLACSSLFYEGRVACDISVVEYDEANRPLRESLYNVYSLPLVKAFLEDRGYSAFQYAPFHIDIPIPVSNPDRMGTYTRQLADGELAQFSGPLLMPWHFLAAERLESI